MKNVIIKTFKERSGLRQSLFHILDIPFDTDLIENSQRVGFVLLGMHITLKNGKCSCQDCILTSSCWIRPFNCGETENLLINFDSNFNLTFSTK